MKLLVTGDLVVNTSYDSSNQIDKGLVSLFQQSCCNIVNLEAPITESDSRILKTGPHLKSDKNSVLDVFSTLNIDIVTLANNHVLDYDKQGVSDTINFCKRNNVKTVGAGANLEEASRTLYVDTEEGKIAIVNFAENEWASATETTSGANPMDIISNAQEIKKAKEESDFVFVIVHGGHEYYNLPSPRMQKQYRFYVEQGADVVVGHHTHCISGFEEYKGASIYYSLGNFLFTHDSPFSDWYTGLILEIEILKGKLKTSLHPVKQEKENFKLVMLEEKARDEVFVRIDHYNEIIKESNMLFSEWMKYVESKLPWHLNYFSPIVFVKNHFARALLNKLGISLINKHGLSYLLNLLRCEAHSDLSKEVIRKYLIK